jgi:hypothetical protein
VAKPALTPEIVPYWERLGSVLNAPFAGMNLWVTLVLTLLLATFGFFWQIRGLILLAMWWYAFNILHHTANGDIDNENDRGDVPMSAVTQFLIINAILLIAMLVTAYYYPEVALVMAVVVLGILPAIMISMAMSEYWLVAINPLTWLELIKRIGWPYLGAVVLLVVIEVIASYGNDGAALSGFLGRLLISLSQVAGTFSTAYLLGYLIYQYHERLDFTPKFHTSKAPDFKSPDDETLEVAQRFVLAGQDQDALRLLEQAAHERIVGLPVHALIHQLLIKQGDTKKVVSHGARYLNILGGDKTKAAEMLPLLKKLCELDASYVPDDPGQGRDLLSLLSTKGEFPLMFRILAGMLKMHPRHRDAARWASFGARTMIERGLPIDKAWALLDIAKARAVDDDAKLEIEELSKRLPARAAQVS